MTNCCGRSRALALMLALVTVVWAACALTACASADENQIRGVIKESFAVLKEPSEDKLSAYLDQGNEDYDKLSAYGTDIYEFLEHSNAKLEYEVESIEIKDDKAKVKLRLSNVDLAAASEAASKDITDNIGSYGDILGGENAESELVKSFIQGYYSHVDAMSDTTTELIEVSLRKENGSWKLDKDSYKKLVETSMREVRI